MNVSTSLRLPADSYFPEKHTKDLIVLHHTVGGSAKSTFEYWRTDEWHIGTAYIVNRDGTVYEVFPPECWAYHLGLKTTREVDKRSIGIEIASEGALLERGGNYYAFGRLTEATRYTGPVFDVDAEASAPGISAVSTAKLWRDYRYFAQYTPAALASVFALVNELLTRFVRSDKSDVHPGFAWEQLIAACRLAQTTSSGNKMLVASVAGAGAKIS